VITNEEVREYLKTVGKRGFKVLAVIEQLKPFIDLVSSGVGEEILKEDIETHSATMNKIYNDLLTTGEADRGDVIKFQYLHKRIQNTYNKFANYEGSIAQVKAVGKK